MRTYIFFFILGMSIWTGFGALFGGLGAKLLHYTWVWQAVGYGTLSGAILGFLLSLIGYALSSRLSSPKISWLVVGALFGAILGVVGLMLIGGYPTNTQADLVMVAMTPPTVIIGAIVGAIANLVTWKVYHR